MKLEAVRKPYLLWFDLTHNQSVEELIMQFRIACHCRLAKGTAFPEKDGEPIPDMICMHYDRPEMPGLNLLLEIKLKAPSIPIAMFTVQHSEELAVWAMRSRVWEYMVLPLSAREISRFLSALQQLCELHRTGSSNKTLQIEHGPSLPNSIRLTAEHQKRQALNDVLQYIDQHFRDSIDQKILAKRCGMTTFRFSRLFKEVNGLGFMDYVLSKRMDSARDLLNNSQMPITSIGYEVGFKDPSYFARAFKQLAGCTPSEYRQAHREAPAEKPASYAELTGIIDSLPRLVEH
ncbi:response regulator transcription factor [Pseudomonas protegens]|uniref:response regulator transcription factor n=1 Tax=Pseudomonas chlororaphis group TaxID=136842 RepID=UPI00209A6C35|nr:MULTISPECIES: response regulator transcription factor [Pseudomonas chlororaphis group]MCO7573868.1 response regulator transcription factor [Pseudomonas chlororaphis]MCO7592220.1 response regulator transcription factor [Pseudomonas chlororaphis]WOE81730.1 response regulator transcription factor [Pseudomonas protegens]